VTEDVPQLGFVSSASWEQVGRDAVAGELVEARYAVEEEFRELEATLRDGGELDAGSIRDARMALNQARRVLERHIATIAEEAEPWGNHVPSMPASRAHEVYCGVGSGWPNTGAATDDDQEESGGHE